jgi:ATP-dependent DNA helicase PIF1
MDWFYKLDVPESIDLCVGCQVYVTHNITIECGIVNGTRGVIISMDERSVTIQKTDGIYYTVSMYRMMEDENEKVWVEFMPLRLAFALTIHKSQGMTLDAIEIDLGENIFEYGQAYTAISRAKTLDSIRIVHFNPKAIKTHLLVRQFYEELNVS